MKSVIGVYDAHEKAVDAIKRLKNAGYPVKQITILGQGHVVDGEARIKSVSDIVMKEVSIGAVVGSILGVLVGVGMFAIPGFGFLFGAGALFSGFVGFEAGIFSGGVVAILTSIGIDITGAARYQQQLNEGKFMVIVMGSPEEIDLAWHILESGNHAQLSKH